MGNQQRLLVLGASSWIGYLLVNHPAMQTFFSGISGTVFKNVVKFDQPIEILETSSGIPDLDRIKLCQPTHVINLLRGETENDYLFHDKVISYCEQNDINYMYASSALALDGYGDSDLTEDLEAKAVSEYGMFKARCERRLYDSHWQKWAILRFASVQGYVSHKQTRNEIFLNKMMKGETVVVDRGVVQNRMLAKSLVNGISKLLQDRITGIIHFGTIDSSEEYDFLCMQAANFGWDPRNIVSGQARKVNLNIIPGKVFRLYGNEFKVTEGDTMNGLLSEEGLMKYKNN